MSSDIVRLPPQAAQFHSSDRTGTEHATHRPYAQLNWPGQLPHLTHVGRTARAHFPSSVTQRELILGLNELEDSLPIAENLSSASHWA